MVKRNVVIDGHPDPDPARFSHALVAAYAAGAATGGHDIRTIALSSLDVPTLRCRRAWEIALPQSPLRDAQDAIGWAEHLLLVYPLWLGSMPALVKAFFEQVFRPGFAIKTGERTIRPGLLNGKSARIVVTMGMPALVYRWYFGAHSLKSLERNILRFSGIGPISETLIGSVETIDLPARSKWLHKLQLLGREGR
jgi:putative NADPH-quinone reductase